MSANFDPYYEWLGIAPKDQPPHAYRLLGIDLFEANPKVIETAAEQRSLLLRTRATGQYGEATQKLLNEVQRARLLLLDPQKKTAYDADLRRQQEEASEGAVQALPRAIPLDNSRAAIGPPPASVQVREPLVRPKSEFPVVALAAGGAAVLGLGVVAYLLLSSPSDPPKQAVQRPPAVPSPADKPADPRVAVLAPAASPPVFTVGAGPDETDDPATQPVGDDSDRLPDAPSPVAGSQQNTPSSPVQPSIDERLSAPRGEELQRAQDQFDEALGVEWSAVNRPADWQVMENRLINLAQESRKDPATRFYLLTKAREAATSAGDPDRMLAIAGMLQKEYVVDLQPQVLSAWERLLAAPVDAQRRSVIVSRGLEYFDQLMDEDQFEAAGQFSTQLAEAVRLTSDKELAAVFSARQRVGSEFYRAKQAHDAALQRLGDSPNDGEALLDVGKYQVLRGRDWQRAAENLSKCSQPAWQHVGSLELQAPQQVEAQVELADAWFELAAACEGALKESIERRAGVWYRTALSLATGVTRVKIEGRLAALPMGSGSAANLATRSSLPTVSIVQAILRAGSKSVEVTTQLKQYHAQDSYAGLAPDSRSMGDASFTGPQQLDLKIAVDGSIQTITIPEGDVSTLPLLPEQGLTIAGADKDFRIVEARYGAGQTWENVTGILRGRITHPGEVVTWNALSFKDPWPKVAKHVIVWFTFDGKWYSRTFRAGQEGPLLAGYATQARPSTIDVTYRHASWKRGDPAVQLTSNAESMVFLRKITGDFAGYGENVGIQGNSDLVWQLGGKSAKWMEISAWSAINPELRSHFIPVVREFIWTRGTGTTPPPPTKMLHSRESVCVLSGLAGALDGAGHQAYVQINPEDGYWYVSGSGRITVRALAYRLKPTSTLKLQFGEFRVRRGSNAVRMLSRDEGFCFLAGVRGNFLGGGEAATVDLHDNGFWYSNLRVIQEAHMLAYSVRLIHGD